LTSSREAVAIVQDINHPNVRFQFDTFHLETVDGHLPELFQRHAPWIGHVQFADYPARGQPGTGTIDFDVVLEALRAAGYRGFIGLEFVPQDAGLAALAWVPEDMRRRGAANSQRKERPS
jgi:hydroxypyruvate isomerase